MVKGTYSRGCFIASERHRRVFMIKITVVSIREEKDYDALKKAVPAYLIDDGVVQCLKKYIGLNECLKRLEKRIIGMCNDSINYVSIVHGDLAFSNILYSPRNTIFKFIDPRGNFVIDTIYGDYRYDLAKLRHCYHGRYDEIINDFRL